MEKKEFVWTDELACDFAIFADKARNNYKGQSEFPKALEDFKKSKTKPLFTTEDGVKIHSWHEVVWFVNSAWYIGSEQASNYNTDKLSHFKYFSTEEKARDYVLMNKPCLSAHDIIKYFNSWAYKPNSYVENKIKELAKQKINV